MKEPKVFLKDTQRQQLIKPQAADLIVDQPQVEPGDCQTRNVCGQSNSSIGGSEDILF
ncbi:MAG TPA: hypothetical protein VM802_01765 [Chitinophaga sp.]|uniref:hypothetical protein n=1 Tax=Chitinophaga sp. TaxID=1869181 RepID=UPI002BD082A6|nr:hypothetical protein [Chitinophaga sp.]HVI43559.1 hypothetical protein [Chitinophaga sp.]